jgi:hypothetical protein
MEILMVKLKGWQMEKLMAKLKLKEIGMETLKEILKATPKHWGFEMVMHLVIQKETQMVIAMEK